MPITPEEKLIDAPVHSSRRYRMNLLQYLSQKGVRAATVEKFDDLQPVLFEDVQQTIIRIPKEIVRNFMPRPKHWRTNDDMASWSHNSLHLLHCPMRVRHMLQHFCADHSIKRAFRKGQVQR